MTEPIEWKVTRLPRRGPKPGQSQESFLRGKTQGDKNWDKRREKNFTKLLNPKASSHLLLSASFRYGKPALGD